MTPTVAGGLIALWIGIAGVAGWTWTLAVRRRRTLRRLDLSAASAARVADDGVRSPLGWWLFRAGFRSPAAVPTFAALTVLSTVSGVGVAVAAHAAGLVDLAAGILTSVPGHVGEILLPFAWASPWLAAATLAVLPAAAVRARRRRRVTEVEQDLPVVLDLLAALAEAGFGFDAALDRLLETQPRRRALSEDLASFQVDVLAGRPRVEALRRLSKRVDVPWFSIFASAVVHAEQVGAGLSQTLRTQADDLRMRRRERALAQAMAVPVKLLGPLIVCFLPGIMVAALGPVVLQIVQVLDSMLQGTVRP